MIRDKINSTMAKIDFAKGHGTILSGSVKYARLTEKSGKDSMSDKYTCDLYLDEKSSKYLEDIKILDFVRSKDSLGNFKVTDANVVRLKASDIPRGYLANRQSFDGLIGDGSTIRANVWIKRWEYNGKKGLSIWLGSYVLTNLIPYEGANDDALFDDMPADAVSAADAASMANPPSKGIEAATASTAFDDEDIDDLPFI